MSETCTQGDQEALAIVDRLHTLRPASEYHMDMGHVLWWWLPDNFVPAVAIGWHWREYKPENRPTHFSPLPLSQLLTATDGAEVTR